MILILLFGFCMFWSGYFTARFMREIKKSGNVKHVKGYPTNYIPKNKKETK